MNEEEEERKELINTKCISQNVIRCFGGRKIDYGKEWNKNQGIPLGPRYALSDSLRPKNETVPIFNANAIGTPPFTHIHQRKLKTQAVSYIKERHYHLVLQKIVWKCHH